MITAYFMNLLTVLKIVGRCAPLARHIFDSISGWSSIVRFVYWLLGSLPQNGKSTKNIGTFRFSCRKTVKLNNVTRQLAVDLSTAGLGSLPGTARQYEKSPVG